MRWRYPTLFVVLLQLQSMVHAIEGVVVDAGTGRAVPLAHVVVSQTPVRADDQGRFFAPPGGISQAATVVSARAPGYRRGTATLPAGTTAPLRLALRPVTPKALYLTPYGIGDHELRADALHVIEQTELNALVIDVKGDRSIVPYRSAAYAAAGLGVQSPVTVHDMPGLLGMLHERGLYLIARVVVFKDDRLAESHPEWAVRRHDGTVWHDREDLAWIDPMRREAWELSLGVAEEAAEMGFDEVQFDYLRFPDTPGLRFAEPDTEDRRIAAIGAYLDEARARLARYNVFVAADIFGYVCWNENDTQIGQQLEALADRVDYLSPMLYPSGFTFGIPGHRLPVAAPFEIVHHSLRQALWRTGLAGVRFRPWLQAFRDYAFDRREFDADEVRAQIDAAEALGTDGWMLWNARNRYSAAGLKAATQAEAGASP